MTEYLAETPEERRRERDETFCMRMIELSILAATLCGVLITFTYETQPKTAGAFMITASFFITDAIGFALSLAETRGRVGWTTRNLKISNRMRTTSLLLFLAALMFFFIDIANMARLHGEADSSLLVLVCLPFFFISVAYMYFHYSTK